MHRLTTTGRGCGDRTASLKEKERRHVAAAATRPLSRLLPIALVCAAQVAASLPVRADPVPETMNGLPLLPIPTYEEVGLPAFTMPTGTVSNGTATPPAQPGATDTTGNASDSTAMTLMTSRSWGEAAAANAEAVGVSAVAVAATCTLESICTANPGGTGTISGAFQMTDASFTSSINAALARNPNLAANIVPGLAGKLDPATQAIASAEYLRQGAEYLQVHDVPNPSVLDARGFYNFGPTNAVAVAQAPDTALMSSELPNLSAAQMRANGIDPATTTVGQWRANITGKIGASAANSPVLLTSS